MKKLQALKIALLIVILAEEIKRAVKQSIIGSRHSEIKILNENDQVVVLIDKSSEPIKFFDDRYSVALKPN